MSLPTLEQYNEAAQNPASAFYDAELKLGSVKTSGLGIPLAACGGFALTYTVTSGSAKYAVRCFHKEARDREKRYAAISKKLSALKSDFFVGFNFQEKGIRVNGETFPVVKMSWARGETIGEFVDANFKKRDAILSLKQSVHGLAYFLENNHIAHGDIQPGNLMVADGGQSIQLIDYDGMYVPEIDHLMSAEIGHRNFQHPDRARLNPWNERTDRFSFILLSNVLEAIAINPELWIKSKSDGDKFLIGANDFVAPQSSDIFKALSSIPSMRESIGRFLSVCYGNYDDIPSLADFLNTSFKIEVVTHAPARKVGYISTYPVLDAKNYEQCFNHVGDMVELVGKVEDVYSGRTRWNKPYYFLNFSDWRGKAVKISIWSNYLGKSRGTDYSNLKGKFISVIGLMQPPYHGKLRNVEYTHLSISLDTTVNEIDANEANYRLNYEKSPLQQTAKSQIIGQNSSNQDILEGIRGGAATSSSGKKITKQKIQSTAPTSRHLNSQSSIRNANKSNSDILHDIKNSIYSEQPQNYSGKPTRVSSHTFSTIQCPICNTSQNIGTSGTEIVRCAQCGSTFEYSHSTRSIRILTTSNTGGRTPTQKSFISLVAEVGRRIWTAMRKG